MQPSTPAGEIDHLRVRVIPGETFRRDFATVAAVAIPSIVHAPHHGHGVNPCAPEAYNGRPLPEIRSLNLRHFHLSNAEEGSIADRHHPLDHPGGGLPFHDVVRCIQARPATPVSLEYCGPAEFYASQVTVFDAIYRKYS